MSENAALLKEFNRIFQEQMQAFVNNDMLYRLWVSSLVATAWNPELGVLQVQCNNHQQLSKVRQTYQKEIQRLGEQFFDVKPIEIAFVVRSNTVSAEASEAAKGASSASGNAPGNASAQASTAPAQASTAPAGQEPQVASSGVTPMQSDDGTVTAENAYLKAAEAPAPKRRGRPRKNPEGENSLEAGRAGDMLLLPEYTFENFISGDFNSFAYSAAQQVANNPGDSQINPLYIYGATGLGKTHLMQAIGHEIQAQFPEKAICYINSSDFLSRFTKAAFTKSYEQFRAYFSSFDVLLLDDIQNLQQKNATQVEFFNLYEFMLREKRQIVVASDCYPSELSVSTGMMSRLVNRLRAGVVVEINPPGVDMRAAILEHEALRTPEIELDPDAAFFIAKNVPYSIRELKGVWKQVILWAQFSKATKITEALVQDALKGHLRSYSVYVTTDQVIRMVAEHYRLTVPMILGKGRTAEVVFARHVAMYLSRALTGQSYPHLAKAFNRKDHTTILYSYNKIEEARKIDQSLNRTLHILEQNIKG